MSADLLSAVASLTRQLQRQSARYTRLLNLYRAVKADLKKIQFGPTALSPPLVTGLDHQLLRSADAETIRQLTADALAMTERIRRMEEQSLKDQTAILEWKAAAETSETRTREIVGRNAVLQRSVDYKTEALCSVISNGPGALLPSVYHLALVARDYAGTEP